MATQGILLQVTLDGDAEPIVINRLPNLSEQNVRVTWIVEGHANPVRLIQGENGPGIPVPVDGDFPVPVGPLPLYGGPDRVLIDEADTEVTITLVRV